VTQARSAGFSLVEVTIALGVVAISLLTLFALIPVGLKTNQNSISQTAATSVMTAVLADMRATPKASATSTQFAVTFGTAKTLYFDAEGSSSASPRANSRYRVTISFPPGAGGSKSPTLSYIQTTWPALATPANAVGHCEMFAAFDRN
jgi:uncharacterized protein (TIGR02598 family)